MGAGGFRLPDMVEEPARDCGKPSLQGAGVGHRDKERKLKVF